MQFEKVGISTSLDRATLLFLIGVALAMLAMWFPFIPGWQTFIHMWRVEIIASIVLVSSLAYVIIRSRSADMRLAIATEEWLLIILPILALIIWSGLSAVWAPSWKSAVHHALIWTEYLVFYLIFRHMLRSEESVRPLLFVFVVTLVLYSLPAIFEYCALLVYEGKTTIGTRFAKYGEQVITIAPIVALGVIRTRGRAFLVGATVMSLLWLLIFCSLGRANYLLFAGVMVGLFVVVLISRRYRRYAPRFALLTVILIAAPLPLHVFLLFSNNSEVPVLIRATDSTAYSSSNNFRKLMISVSTEMIREHPLIGIGADNFGTQVNVYRQRYGAAHPDDANLAAAEDQIPGHAHNELLQIATELGLVGVLITGWLVVGIGIIAYRAGRQIQSGSLYPIAAVIGLGAFLVSSLVSAYSFRVMQNGILFFFVLAFASKFAFRRSEDETEAPRGFVLSGSGLRAACVVAIVACLGLMIYSTVRVASSAITVSAHRTRPLDAATPMFQRAMDLDDENPDARHAYGMRLFRRQRYAEAIPYLQAAVAMGRAPSSEISYLASAQSLSGDDDAAEATMKMASELYPNSPFVLIRYATLLESRGKSAEAAPFYEKASSIDKRSAATWRAIITLGPKEQSELTARDYASYKHISELMPQSGVYAVVTERYIKHPEERRFSLYKVFDEE